MRKKLADLLEVRKIIAFITVLLFVYLSIKGELEKDFIQNVVLIVIAFYFAKSTALDTGDKK